MVALRSSHCAAAVAASIWFSEEVCTREQWNYILDFLDRVRVIVLELCDDDPSLDT
jgi:hypothetical protein